MKRFLASVLALVMALSAMSAGALSVWGAENGKTFSPTAAPGVTEGETVIETGIDGMKLTVGADEWTYGEAEDIVSASGVAYTGYITGKANPAVEEAKGTYFTFAFDDTVKTGSLEVMYRLNSNKAFFILDNGEAMPGYDGMKLDVSADTSTTLIVEGGHSYTIYAKGSKLRLYGCTFQNVDPAQVFAQEIAAFPFARIKGANADADHVDEDLVLVDSYESQFGSCDVSWTSTDAKIVDTDGTVNCQKAQAKVTLTGHFSVQENRAFAADVSFDLTVLADPDDNSAVAVATEALTLGDTSSVKRDLTLPTAGKRGTTVTWATSDESVVDAQGKVYPAANEDHQATLTATVSRGNAQKTKTFAITVPGIVPITMESCSYKDAQGNLRFTPVDGGAIYSVNLTCNNPNPNPGDVIVATVCGPDGEIKASKTVAVLDSALATTPTGKSVAIELGLQMDSGDTFTLTAMNADTNQEYIQPVTAKHTLAEDAVIYVVGDSTASVYGDDRYPRKGWAQMLEGYFDGVTVTDLALSGRSSRSFKSEANYATLQTSLKKGDYLIVQFGHNDDKADAYADPAGDRFTQDSYKQSMLEYVELAWEKGANPIIATSISRRKLSDEALEKYVVAARELAAELNVPCIDLYESTNGWINEVGVDAATDLFNTVKPHDSRFADYPAFAQSEFYEKGSTDDTHINIYGADLISQWAVDAMKALGLPVAAKVNARRAAYPLPSYAAATSGEASELPFVDVARKDWYYDSVKTVWEKNLFSGTDSSHFGPDVTTSRAMVATVLWRQAGAPVFVAPEGADVPSRNYYPDLVEGQWYTEAVRWCTEQGVVTGQGDGTFAPDGDVTREQLAVMLYRFAKAQGMVKEGEIGALTYADAEAVGPWAVEAMSWCAGQGVLTGKPGNLADPQGNASRAEVAAVLARFVKLR